MTNNSNEPYKAKWEASNKIVRQNAVTLAILALLVLGYVFSVQSDLKEGMRELRESLDESAMSAIGLTEDGKVLNIDRMVITAVGREEEVARPLINYFLVSGFELTDGLKKTRFADIKEVLDSSFKLKRLYNEFIDVKLPSFYLDDEKQKNYVYQDASKPYTNRVGRVFVLTPNRFLTDKLVLETERAKKQFNAYLEHLRTSLISGNLPHKIVLKKYSIEKYETNRNKFTMTLKLKVNISSLRGVDSEGREIWKSKKGTSEIITSGYFDIRTRTRANKEIQTSGENPMGMHYTDFRFTLVSMARED